MKIVHVITSLGVGGAEAMLLKMIAGLDPAIYEQTIITLSTTNSFNVTKAAELGATVKTLGMSSTFPNPAKIFQLAYMIRKEHPDIVQTWLYHADLIGTMAAKVARIPAVAWNIRCSFLDRKDHPRSLFWIIRMLAELSNIPEAIIVNSAAGRVAHEAQGYSPKRWELIPNGFDTSMFKPSMEARLAFRERMGLTPEDLLIGMVARYHPMKDHETFLRAAGMLHRKRKDVRFVLAGLGVDRSNERLAEAIEKNGVDGIVSLLGEQGKIQQIAAAMDIATLASYSEGFPNTIGEAMSCGVPCVAADAGETRELIGETGLVIPARDPEALADAWEKIISMEPHERTALGMAARTRVIERYSLESVVRRYQDLYTEIVKRSGRGN